MAWICRMEVSTLAILSLSIPGNFHCCLLIKFDGLFNAYRKRRSVYVWLTYGIVLSISSIVLSFCVILTRVCTQWKGTSLTGCCVP